MSAHKSQNQDRGAEAMKEASPWRGGEILMASDIRNTQRMNYNDSGYTVLLGFRRTLFLEFVA
jgi:hypothetical protein